MIELFKKEDIKYKVMTVLVIGVIVFFVYRMIYAGIIALPYPKEILEPANIELTNLFIEGRSPYSLDSLSWPVPAVNYDYPFFNSLLAAVIARITGCSAVIAHFAISLTSILATGVLGFVISSKYARTTVSPALATLLFMICHWRYGYISAAPDDLGLLLFLLTLYISTHHRVIHKSVLCAAGVTLSFYTKQYFAFSFVVIFVYMLLYSRKEAAKLFVWTAVFNIIAGVTVSCVWPIYWTRSVFYMYIGAVTGGGSSILHLFEQVKYLAVTFAVLFAILIIAVITALRNNHLRRDAQRRPSVKENDIFTLFVVQIAVMVIPLIFLGRNDGAFGTYFLQLWMPPIIVVTLVCFEKMSPGTGFGEKVFGFIYLLMTAFLVYFGLGRLPLHILSKEEISNWEKAYEYIEIYSKKGDIFYDRCLAYQGFIRKNGEWMCGHDGEMFVLSEESELGEEIDPAVLRLFPYAKQLSDNWIQFQKDTESKSYDRDYALITFEYPGLYYIYDDNYCRDMGYEQIDRMDLQVGNMPYDVVFYAPAGFD